MELADLTPLEAIYPSVRTTSKKALLQELSRRLSSTFGVEQRELFNALSERERLGTTGVGGGVAIPHCRMASVQRMCGGFARLEAPIDFEAVDSEPVDLVYVLIAPEHAGADHLKALARVSRVLRDRANCAKLRGAADVEAISAVLASQERPKAA
ncbi:MAG: PTS sugar transporter subunit IIA [Pseudomonadota bacterium]